ncbi:MAG: hypothetical protein JNN20_08520 [Betaproteobacteria bacterium]|nr:hypothetical protein [Betaproteobacteria bacterium]
MTALPPQDSEGNPTGSLLATVARLLAPVVRLLIARGVPYQVASELLKRVYVESAQRHFADEDATGTRLSLLTGLNRKEIRRLTTEAANEKRPEDIASFASATHAVWSSVRRWRDRDGNPKPLPRRSDGRQLSFDDLVRSITLDHRPAAVLEELTRLGYATEDDEGIVRLNPAAFLTQQSFADRLLPLGENLEDHANAAVANVLAEQPPFLERSVFSDELSAEAVAQLARAARTQWQRVHDETIAQAIAAEEADITAGRKGDMRIRVGMYFYAEKKKDEEA